MNRIVAATITTALLSVTGPVLMETFAVAGQTCPRAGCPGAPSAPIVQASVKGTTVLLVWIAPSGGVTGYRIDAGTAPGSTLSSTTLGAVTSFATTLPQGTYYFRVYALNGSVISPPSNEVRVDVGNGAPPPSGTLPSAPTNLTAVVSGSAIALSWNAPGGTVTGYRLDAGLSPGSTIASSTLGPITSFTAFPIPAGTYYVRVHAFNSTGVSLPSNEVRAVVGDGGGGRGCSAPPEAPVAVSFTVVGNLVSVSWNPGDACPGSTFILHAGSAPGSSNIAIANVGATSRLSASAPAGVYYVRIYAQNAFGLSAASSEVTIRVGGASPPPGPPTSDVAWRPCSEVARSTASVTPVPLEFVNTASQPRKLYWIDFTGTPRNYGVLSPGQRGFITSWVTHSWVVADLADNCLETFVVAGGESRVAIR